MDDNEIIVSSIADDNCVVAVMGSLAAAAIHATLIPPSDLSDAHPNRLSCPTAKIFVAVSKSNFLRATTVVLRVSRFCQKCDAFLFAEDLCCHKCGEPHSERPHSLMDR